MFKTLKKLFSINILFFTFLIFPIYADIVEKIEIVGNKRISAETIKMFSQVKIGMNYEEKEINNILKLLYETNFFKDIKVSLNNKNLIIIVDENPIIENITFNGIKSNTLRDKITKDLLLKERSSYNEILLKRDKNLILASLKELGYYFSEVDINKIELDNDKIDIIYNIDLGEKSKIKKITFIGNKIFKDNKLKSLIISEEYKFWKFISGKKYLNENIIKFDKRLLRNFYLNKGYYDVMINSSFAKLVEDDGFELVFNIDPKNKFFFGDLTLEIPLDFDEDNFQRLREIFLDLKNEPYSINSVENIINEIDKIAIDKQYESIKAKVSESIIENKINLKFIIEETEKFFVEKINIFGNNITRENVIRNQFYIDEGDPFNDILTNKTINEIKSLNFFSSVESEIIDGKDNNSKIINIMVEEKPTGEIMAGAGFGTSGEVIEFGIKENNYLGKGLSLETNLSLATDKVEGMFNLTNPNFNNSDKSIDIGFRANELDKLTTFGYKSKKVGGAVGTKFEYLENFKLGLSVSSFVENIETDSTASARQKKQKGDYFDIYTKINFDYDQRNQKFKTSDGFRSYYSIDVPLVSDNNTLTNFYNYKFFSELYENNLSSFSLSLSSANSITGDDIKLSERLYIPQRKLRGFVSGKIGPKDGSDYIGGNYYAVMNFSSSLPQILPNSQNLDIGTFVDIANLWGVDDSSLDESSELRSSFGVGLDWYSPVGPFSFSLAQPLSKSSTDVTETFRFNLGTTF